eukprot:6309534-Prymnesium_polylepis.1
MAQSRRRLVGRGTTVACGKAVLIPSPTRSPGSGPRPTRHASCRRGTNCPARVLALRCLD